ncbi:MAG: peptidoglycan bridge formation glycyltransferase FemA/FemB family protein [Nitrospiraceae bacterium]|nr:peptidoglycan bridge formation glycyltransferase FemA/FemB family protein [Nitrospiraceae bacterium]
MNEIYRIVSLEDVDKEDWRDFVHNHSCGSIFQTHEMRGVYEQTKNYEPISLAAINDSEEIVALVQAVVIKEMGGFLGGFSARSVIQGGPLFVDSSVGYEAVSLLMNEYDRIARKRALYSEIRNIYDMSEFRSLFKQMGYVYEDHLNYLIDLDRPQEEIGMAIHRSMRKNIKRSQKKGVVIREVTNKSQLKIFYGFLEDVYHNAKIPFEDMSHFDAIFDILVPRGMATFHLAEHGGEYIGGRVTLIYKGVVYAYSVGVPNKYKHLYPNALLNWEIIQWGAENGCNTFDFGGAGKPDRDYGVREFKRQFGGELVNYGRCKKIYSPVKMGIAEMGLRVYKKSIL